MSEEGRQERGRSGKKPDKPNKPDKPDAPQIGKEADAAARADHEKQFLAETQERFHSLQVEADGAAAVAEAFPLPQPIPAETLTKLEALRHQALQAKPPEDEGRGSEKGA